MSLLSVHSIGKAYRSYQSEWHRFANWFGLSIKPREEHWVLRNINLDIHPGEAIGIIGQNGAGKSTLLKIIAGTLQPTEGHVQIHGRIAAILELGMGFNPERTGRQNVLHAAGLMGFTAEQIQQAMPDIEAFSEIGEYFDEPVRTYSSGMQMRVAFSVATAFQPDILIVDEALSVGDVAFQRKCFARFEEFRNKGTTLLFVTHSTELVKRICDKALFIKDGNVAGFGSAKAVCDEYEKSLFKTAELIATTTPHNLSHKYDASLIPSNQITYGNNKAQIFNYWIQDIRGEKINIIEVSNQFEWCFDVTFHEDIEHPIFNMQIKTVDGVVLFGTNSDFLGHKYEHIRAGEVAKVKFSLVNHLAPGNYFLNCGVKERSSEHGEEMLHRRVDAAILKVVASDKTTAPVGVVDLGAKLSLIFGNE